MKTEEQITLKAACVHAAATLMANPNKGGIDVGKCAKLARQLYDEITSLSWPKPSDPADFIGIS